MTLLPNFSESLSAVSGSLDSAYTLTLGSVPEGRTRTHPSSVSILTPSVVSTTPSPSYADIASMRRRFSSSGQGYALSILVHLGSLETCSDRGPFLAMHSSITARPMAPSLQYWWSANMSPPLPSPPKAPSHDIILRATSGDPTAVRNTVPPAASTASWKRDEVATGVTAAFLSECERTYPARRARLWSPVTKFPSPSTKTALSASPSWATPRSAPVALTSEARSFRFSGTGSLGRPGNSPWGSAFRVTHLTPRRLSSSGDVLNEAPFPQSRHTVRPAERIASASTFETIERTYASPAPVSACIVPTSLQPTAGTSASYMSSMALSSSCEHSVPSDDMHLMPLYSGGLWDAVIMIPPVISACSFT